MRGRIIWAGASLAAGALLALTLTLAVAPAGNGRSADAVRDLRVGDGHGGIGKRRIGSFAQPTYVTQPPGFPHHLYVVEAAGTVRVLHNGNRRRQPFLDIRARVSTGGERGLLSIAFDPHYRRNGLLYAYYTNRAGNIEIDEFRARTNGDAREGSRRRVIVIRHPRFANHNGGQLQFGPNGRLYIGTGDGGGAGDPRENAQDKGVLLGKLLRIDPHRRGSRPYKAPRGNPYVGRAGQNEIYARGLRNPYRFAFDRGRIVLGDVGQYRWEEVDYETRRSLRGANFGWDRFEGDHRFDHPGDNEAQRARHYEKPIFEYRHTARNCGSVSCAIIGGYVVRSRRLRSLRGRYLYADFYSGKLRSFVARRRHGRRDRALGVRVPHPSSFGKGAGGRIYVASLDGPVYRLVRR
ncbi:MAG: PQQ-dependent sugar dehydrogenase [Actinomycetota bacterium]